MPSLSEELRDKILKIPVRMGKRELGGLLSANEIDQILEIFKEYAVRERIDEQKNTKLCEHYGGERTHIEYRPSGVEAGMGLSQKDRIKALQQTTEGEKE